MIQCCDERYGRYLNELINYNNLDRRDIIRWYPYDRASVIYELPDGYIMRYDKHQAHTYPKRTKDEDDIHIGDKVYIPSNDAFYQQEYHILRSNWYYSKDEWKDRFVEHYQDINRTLRFTKTHVYENTGLSIMTMTNCLNKPREIYDCTPIHNKLIKTYEQSIPSLYTTTKIASAMYLPLSQFEVPTSSVIDIYKLMACEQWDSIIDDLKQEYPRLMSEAIDWRIVGYDEILVTLHDGTVIVFDINTLNKTTIYNPNRDNFISKEEWKEIFSERLSYLMYKKRISQREMVRTVGVTQAMFSRYMNGEAIPDLYKATIIARALDCSLTEFHII